MKILIISENGEGLELAHALAKQGESVKAFCRLWKPKIEGVEMVGSWRPALPWSDLVIVTSPKLGPSIDPVVRKLGRPSIGCSTDRPLEQLLDRTFDPIGIVGRFCIWGMFNGRKMVEPLQAVVAWTRFMDGDRGIETMSMGALSAAIKAEGQLGRIVESVEDVLKASSYRGPWFIKIESAESSLRVVDASLSFHYDGLACWIEGVKGPLIDPLFELAQGVLKSVDMTNDLTISVRCSLPPWPFVPANPVGSTKVEGITDEGRKHLLFSNLDEGETTGGAFMLATARGRDLKEARNRVYRTLSNIKVEGIQYRGDIGKTTLIDQLERSGNVKRLH